MLVSATLPRSAGIDVPQEAHQFVATVPDEARPANLRDERYGLSPRTIDGRLHLYLNDPISRWAVNNEHLLHALRGVADDAPFTLHVNCPGGSVFEARAMQATLAGRDVEARIEGLAASAASWLVLAAGRRAMTVGSRVVVHETRIAFYGCTSELESLLPVMSAMDHEIAADYAAATERGADEWLRMMRRDKGRGEELGAAKALEMGLVQEVADVVKPTAGGADNMASTRVDAANRLALSRHAAI